MWRPHLFCIGSRMDARWQEVLGLLTRTRVASTVAREPAARIFFSRSDDSAVACFFSPLSGSGNGGSSCCQLWHAASEPCQCPPARLPK